MPSYTIREAKMQLSRLIRLAEDGQEVIIRRGHKPVARIVAINDQKAVSRRKPGSMRGRINVRDDFDEWPPDIAQALGITP